MTGAVHAAPRLEFLLGRADDVRAEAYVRLVDGPAGAQISGTLTGPRCGLATTLPTTMPLRTLPGPGVTAARAIVTEPSYWTPELPNLYELVAEARDATGTVASMHRLVGLRRLGVRGRSIWLDGRRWVPRGGAAPATGFDPSVFRAKSLVAVITDPSPGACAAADIAGVGIIARLDDVPAETNLAARIEALSQHPSVVMVVLDAVQAGTVAAGGGACGTLLIGCTADAAQPPPGALPSGAHCLVVRLAPGDLPIDAWRSAAPSAPVVAWRMDDAGGDRQACDALQRDLAAWMCVAGDASPWDWAGYIVA